MTGVVLALVLAAESAAARSVAWCELEGTVDSGSAAYLVECVGRAAKEGHSALLVRMDTPGGALESTRLVVQAFLAAEVPVIVWVGPQGARAGSAGVFLTLAAHVASMAHATNIGAAHPVQGPAGSDPEQTGGKEMARKIVNDTAAFAEAIAKQRGRNAEWAAQSVRESVSVSSEKALELKVIDFVADTEVEALEKADGRKVRVGDKDVDVHTRGAQVVRFQPSLQHRLVHALSQPALAYLLFLLGGLGLAIELSHPGLIVPGLLGVVCLVLALIALSALPVRAGAVVLLLMGIALMVAEVFVSHGLMGAAGGVLFVLGGVLLVDRFNPRWFVDPSFVPPLRVILPMGLVFTGMALFLAYRAAQTRRLPQLAGDAGLVGERGVALSEVGPDAGEVFVHGERWRAVSGHVLEPQTPVVVKKVDGLTLQVEEWKT